MTDYTHCLPEGWTIKLHHSFTALSTEWKTLTSLTDVSVFETYEWLSTWYQCLGQQQGYQLHLFAIYDEDVLIRAIIPLGTHQKNRLNVLGFLGGEVTDYRAPIVHPDCWQRMSDQQFLELWLYVTSQIQDVDVIDIQRMRADLSGISNPLCHLLYVSANEHAHAALLPEHYQTFQQTRKSKLFADIRRQKKRLAESGHLVVAENIPVAEQKSLMNILIQQKSQRWLETGSRDLFAEPGYIDFYQQLGQQADSSLKVIMSGLKIDQHWIATHWGVEWGQTFYWILPAYDGGEWNRFSPGKILLDAMVQWSIIQSFQVFDLTVGDEEYKQQWANRTRSLYGGSHGVTVKGRIYVIIDKLKSALKQQIKKTRWLHQAIHVVKAKIANK